LFRWLSALFTLFILVVVIWAMWEARKWEFQTRLTPWLIGIPTALMLAAVMVQELFGKTSNHAVDQGIGSRLGDQGGQILGQALLEEMSPALDPFEERRRTANIIVWILGFALAIWLLGFQVGIPIATFLYLMLAGREGWPIALVFSAGSWASIVLFFDCTLHVFFMEGKLFVWIGLESVQFQAEVCQTVVAFLSK
jgi:CDP-diglyceride synthetase